MTLLGTVGMTGGVNNVFAVAGVVPAGVGPSARCYALIWTTNTGLRNWTVTSDGVTPTVTKLDDQNLGTSAEVALFEITGVTAGDTLTFAWDGSSGKAGGRMAFHDATVQLDAVTAIAATGTSATETVGGLTSTEANEYVFTMATGVGNGARTISSVTGATIRATGTSGGTNRFWADAYADETVATSGTSSGTTTINFSGTLIAFAGYQISLKAAAAPPSGTARKNRVAGTETAATRRARVAAVSTAATRKVRVAGAAV